MSYAVGYVVVGWDLTSAACEELNDLDLIGTAKSLTPGAVGLMQAYSGNGDPPVVLGKCLSDLDECDRVLLSRDGKLAEITEKDFEEAIRVAHDFGTTFVEEAAEEHDMSAEEAKVYQDILDGILSTPPLAFIAWGSS